MIESKEDLYLYIEADELARWGGKVSAFTKWKKGSLWKYNVVLRKLEYSINCKHGMWGKVSTYFYRYRLERLSEKTGWTIPPNTFGPGLLVVHRGTVIVNPNCRIGSNCRVHACVNIGAWDGGAPILGDNIYLGPGAKIFGDIRIADNIAIGANAVVNKTFLETGISIAGVPAVKVSDNGNKYRSLGFRDN